MSDTEVDKEESLVLQRTDESAQLNISLENIPDASQTREILKPLSDTGSIEVKEERNNLN